MNQIVRIASGIHTTIRPMPSVNDERDAQECPEQAVPRSWEMSPMGSAGIAGWIAHLVFWIVLAIGAVFGELGVRSLATLVGLWLAGLVGLPYIQPHELFMPYVAVLDIALVLLVFKAHLHPGGR
jgi:hypothetical protein